MKLRRYRLPAGEKERLEFDDNQPGLASIFAAPARILSFSSTAVARTASARRSVASAKSRRPRRARRRRNGWPPYARAGTLKLEKAKAKVRSSETFGLLLPKFLARQLTEWKARTHQEATYCLNAHTKPFRSLPVSAIDKRMVAARLEEIAAESGPGARNNARSYLSALSGWLVPRAFATKTRSSAPTSVTIAPRQRKLADPETR